jgi:hypothetical protein
MSQKQRSHRNHYVSSLAEFPEDETVPSNVTPIEQLGIELLEEVKIPDGEDEPTPGEMKAQFFTLIAELQRKFPGYSATQFKKFLEEDAGMAEQLQILKDNFNESFKDVSKDDPEFINLLIGLSSIGVEIPKEEDEADEGDECDDEGDEGDEGELAKSIIKIDLEEIVTDV